MGVEGEKRVWRESRGCVCGSREGFVSVCGETRLCMFVERQEVYGGRDVCVSMEGETGVCVERK